MTSKSLIVLFSSLFVLSAHAQNAAGIASEVDTELDQLYAQKPESQTLTIPQQQPAVSSLARPTQIASPAAQTNTTTTVTTFSGYPARQVQKQPTTLIQDAPLVESPAENIRRQRIGAEAETENKIVLKLEQSRMEDEKKRANVLFGDAFNQLQNQNQVAPVQQGYVNQSTQTQLAPIQPQAQQVIQPVVVQTSAEPKENTRDIVRDEIRAALKEEEKAAVTPVETHYFSALVGTAEVPDNPYARGNYSIGAAFGTKYDVFAVEGVFLANNYDVTYPIYYMGYQKFDVKQYSGALALKYTLFSGMVKPVFGGLVQYSYRTYGWQNVNTNLNLNSNAVDLGGIAGADIEFSPKFTLGIEYKYLFNLSSRLSGDLANLIPNEKPLEKYQYWTLSLAGRVTF